ncbi:putative fungal pheromoneG-protein-coupled receptor [Rhodofomes roseus]|uniref:Fungal pheromoneG-protein-coupled receptor n=1 Tax=Rhodofomes roseus TaxID=34475 RepID=A0ABQ8KIQ7_9APHY|nr:putative fungal pheromoneG-protein-coupled receptor [Rhodofomes roseus]KAH9837843.1 putative fungal pheromoneG-protein-coupled receptor [Rhodofomes roseus]
MAADPTYPLYSVFAFIGFILALVPLPWHLQTANTGTCYYMIWTSLACLNEFVNSVVWADNALNVAPVWCDISTRITIGASVGIPAASLCINRRLYYIARMDAVAITRAEKRRTILVDSLICILFPILCMVFAYIVQGHRFNIFEVLGCYPDVYNTLPSIFLVYTWPIVIGLVSAVYCVLSLHSLLKRQAQFKQFLSSGAGLTPSRYYRLMALSMTEILFTTPFGAYEIYSAVTGSSMQPWLGWANTHYNFSRVVQYPAIVWMSNPQLAIPLQLSRWIIVGCAFIFFAFFGFAEEARRRYYALYSSLCSRMHSLRMLRGGPRDDLPFVTDHTKGATKREDTLPPYSPLAASPGWRSLASVTMAGSDCTPIKTSFSDNFSPDEPGSPYDKC